MSPVHGIKRPTPAEQAEIWDTIDGFTKASESLSQTSLHIDIGGQDDPEPLCGYDNQDMSDWVYKDVSTHPIGSKELCLDCLDDFREGQYDG